MMASAPRMPIGCVAIPPLPGASGAVGLLLLRMPMGFLKVNKLWSHSTGGLTASLTLELRLSEDDHKSAALSFTEEAR